MVQILNKMVHLKYPILEILCCNRLPPSRLKFDTKLRKVFPNNVAPQLCTCAFSQGKYILHPMLSVCCSQSNASMLCSDFWLPLALVTLFKCLLQGSNVCAEEYVPEQVCQHRTNSSHVFTSRPIKCMHSKPRFWVHFSHVFTS